MQASIIIPHYNDEDHLKLVLERLLKQSIPLTDYEIIVVGNRNNLSTPKGDTSTIRFINSNCRGAGAACNIGVDAAKSNIIIFLASDILVPPHFINTHINFHVEHKNSIAVGCRYQLWPNDNLDDLYILKRKDPRERILRRHNKPLSEMHHPWFMAYSCNISLERDIALQVRFDEHFSYRDLEDIEWAYRLYKRRMDFNFLKKAHCWQIFHDRNINASRFREWSESLNYVQEKHPELEILSLFREVFDPNISENYFTTYDLFEKFPPLIKKRDQEANREN